MLTAAPQASAGLALYVDDDGLSTVAARAAQPEASAHDLLALAWHLRERNAIECARWADAAQLRYEQAGVADAVFEARMALLRAAQARRDDPRALQPLCDAALAHCKRLEDLRGQADVLMLAARGAYIQGQPSAAVEFVTRGTSLARVCGDAMRSQVYEAMAGFFAAAAPSADDAQMIERLRERIRLDSHQRGSAVFVGHLHGTLSLRLSHLGRTAEAADAICRAIEIYECSGLVEYALSQIANEAMYLYLLGDARAAVARAQGALARATALGFTLPLNRLHSRLGYLFNELGRSADAAMHLREAAAHLMPGSFSAAMVQANLAAVEYEQGHLQASLALSREVEQAAAGFGDTALHADGVGLQAQALSALGRADEAFAMAKRSWAMAQSLGSKLSMFKALLVLARLHHAHRLADPEVPVHAAQVPREAMLYYLCRAQRLMPERMQQSNVARAIESLGVGPNELAAGQGTGQ
jgi:tetratricopeptide (TPR) repeat protein